VNLFDVLTKLHLNPNAACARVGPLLYALVPLPDKWKKKLPLLKTMKKKEEEEDATETPTDNA